MKHLILIGLILGLVGCDSNDDKTTPRKDDSSQVRELKEDNLNLGKKLQTCEELRDNLTQQLQSQASAPQGAASSQNEAAASEPEAAPEPETVDGWKLISYEDIKPNTNIECETAEYKECGVHLADCNDGLNYECLRNVKLRPVKIIK